MTDWMNRNAIINEIVADLIAAGNPTYTALNGLDAEIIKYSEEDPLLRTETRNTKEIWVYPGGGGSYRVASTKFETDFSVRILVLITGWEGVTDKQSAVSLSEDIEHYYKTNPDIGSGPRLAIFRGREGDMTMEDHSFFVETPQGAAGAVNFRLIEMVVNKVESA